VAATLMARVVLAHNLPVLEIVEVPAPIAALLVVLTMVAVAVALALLAMPHPRATVATVAQVGNMQTGRLQRQQGMQTFTLAAVAVVTEGRAIQARAVLAVAVMAASMDQLVTIQLMGQAAAAAAAAKTLAAATAVTVL
jgi:hypothetical protein